MPKHSTKRDLIHDTQATAIKSEIELDKDGSITDSRNANNIVLAKADYERLGQLFKQLREGLRTGDHEYAGFHFNHAEYTYLQKESRILISEDTNHNVQYVRAELTFYREPDSSNKWIRVTYTMHLNGRSDPVLAFIGNPTTIVSGNNIRPIRVVDTVSRFRESMAFYQLGFKLLHAIFADQGFKWSRPTARKIQLGEINVANTQWALYLPSRLKDFDLRLLSSLYCSRRASFAGSSCLAEFLGFDSATVIKDSRSKNRLTGLFLVKRKGSNQVLTINFYDKRESVSNKKQSKSISQLDARVIDNHIRLDITAHRPFLVGLLKQARTHAKRLIKQQPKLEAKLKRFLTGQLPRSKKEVEFDPNRTTAYMICRAMSVLAVERRDEELYSGSFTTWLLHYILEKELHLMSLLQHATNYMQIEGDTAEHKAVLKFWRGASYTSTNEFNKALCQHPAFEGKTANWVYRIRTEIMQRYGVDIHVPYTYWLDFDTLTRDYGLNRAEQEKRYKLHNDLSLSNETVGKMTRRLDKRSRNLLRLNSERMLKSLQLVAKPIHADALDIAQLGD